MQYGHMPMQDRRDPNLDGNGSTSFHPNGLGQALGGHLTAAVPHPPPQTYSRTNEYRTTSPPSLNQPGSSNHAAPSNAHSPLTFAVQQPATSPAMKRKQVDSSMNVQTLKRRRETGGGDDVDGYDLENGGQGAKHWTDEEKSKLFTWLMGPGQEEHWNRLRATKNSCLRDCAAEVFDGKKTYQALKGCYERNFNLFKQIYAFESAHGQTGGASSIAQLPEADRLREYERRLQIARKAGSDVGNITARTIDHWHRVGWYELFYRRWQGDPATTRPIQGRTAGVGNNTLVGGEDAEDEDPTMDFNDHTSHMNGLNGLAAHDRTAQQQQQQHVYINPQDLRDNPPQPPPALSQPSSSTGLRPGQTHPHPSHPAHTPHATVQPQPQPQPHPQPQQQQTLQQTPLSRLTMPVSVDNATHSSTSSTSTPMAFPVTQEVVTACMQYLNLQAKVAQEKLEYLRRREAREVSELNAKREQLNRQNKTEKAIELINNPNIDANLKQVAVDYLKRMFLPD